MGRQYSGDGFDEMLSELIELNGYNIIKTGRSVGGDTDIIATKSDEAGQKIQYLIRCRKNGGLIDKNDVDEIVVAQKSRPGTIAIIASNTGTSRDAHETAEKFGVRLWGESEVEKLRSNVALKRNLKLRQVVDNTTVNQHKPKKIINIKKYILLFVVVAFVIYIYLFQLDYVYNQVSQIGERIPVQNINDTNLPIIYDDYPSQVDRINISNFYDRVEQELNQKNVSGFIQAIKGELDALIFLFHNIYINMQPIRDLVEGVIKGYFN